MKPFDDEEIGETASRIRAIAHPVRLTMVCRLAENEELCVGEIMRAVDTTQANASQHLSCLLSRGLLTSRKDANRVIYSIADQRLATIIGMVREIYCTERVWERSPRR